MVSTIVFAALALYLSVSMLRFVRSAQRVPGTLVGYRSARDDEGAWLHQPVYRFLDARGRPVTTVNPRHIWVVRRLAVGQRCALLVDPARPERVLRDSWLDVWLMPALLWTFCLLGVLRLLAA
jgi:hypothetical protein